MNPVPFVNKLIKSKDYVTEYDLLAVCAHKLSSATGKKKEPCCLKIELPAVAMCQDIDNNFLCQRYFLWNQYVQILTLWQPISR